MKRVGVRRGWEKGTEKLFRAFLIFLYLVCNLYYNKEYKITHSNVD